jgi:hypothetical protein
MRKKLYIWAILVAAVALAVIVGLTVKHFRTTINLDKLSAHMLSSSFYYQGMDELAGADIAARYDMDGADIADSRAYAATDGTAREFAIIRATSLEKADRMMSSLGVYSNSLMDRLSAAGNSEEYQRVRGYVINRTGEYVIFTISDALGSGSLAAKEYLNSTIYDQTR